jgi:hypothetical protein
MSKLLYILLFVASTSYASEIVELSKSEFDILISKSEMISVKSKDDSRMSIRIDSVNFRSPISAEERDEFVRLALAASLQAAFEQYDGSEQDKAMLDGIVTFFDKIDSVNIPLRWISVEVVGPNFSTKKYFYTKKEKQ